MPTSKYFGPSGANASSPSETASAKLVAALAIPPLISPALKTDPVRGAGLSGAAPPAVCAVATGGAGMAAAPAGSSA